jgi:hypothetical protein
MIFGSITRRHPTLLLLTMMLATAQSAEPDVGALVKRLARPAPAQIAFTEIRFSPLLKQPLVVSGQLRYEGPTSLDRQVEQPYQESTQIRGDSVRVTRQGEAERSFALRRAPELRGLLTGFTALLAGDRAALEREFEIATAGTEGNWTLTLVPRDARTRKRLQRMQVHGRANEPSCFILETPKDGLNVLLLGDTAARDLNEIARDVSRDTLLAKCQTKPAAPTVSQR